MSVHGISVLDVPVSAERKHLEQAKQHLLRAVYFLKNAKECSDRDYDPELDALYTLIACVVEWSMDVRDGERGA